MPLVKCVPQIPGRQRRVVILLMLTAAMLPVLWSASFGHAAPVVVSNAYVTSAVGPAQVPETRFPSGTQIVYFDYTVNAASSTDAGEVDILIGGTTSPYVATAPLDFRTAGNRYVPVTPPGGTFPDGAYCANLKNDGVPQTIPNSIPAAFTVGQVSYSFTCPTPAPFVTVTTTITPTAAAATATATFAPPTLTSTTVPTVVPPTATNIPTSTSTSTPTSVPTSTPLPAPTQVIEEALRHFIIAINSSVHVRRYGTLRLYMHGTGGRSVSGVRVLIDGRRLGMRRLRSGSTNAYGFVTFAYLWPPHAGPLVMTARKAGYATVTVEIVVS